MLSWEGRERTVEFLVSVVRVNKAIRGSAEKRRIEALPGLWPVELHSAIANGRFCVRPSEPCTGSGFAEQTRGRRKARSELQAGRKDFLEHDCLLLHRFGTCYYFRAAGVEDWCYLVFDAFSK